jgi:hypothetical protein
MVMKRYPRVLLHKRPPTFVTVTMVYFLGVVGLEGRVLSSTYLAHRNDTERNVSDQGMVVLHSIARSLLGMSSMPSSIWNVMAMTNPCLHSLMCQIVVLAQRHRRPLSRVRLVQKEKRDKNSCLGHGLVGKRTCRRGGVCVWCPQLGP